jgi:hypothetical protein
MPLDLLLIASFEHVEDTKASMEDFASHVPGPRFVWAPDEDEVMAQLNTGAPWRPLGSRPTVLAFIVAWCRGNFVWRIWMPDNQGNCRVAERAPLTLAAVWSRRAFVGRLLTCMVALAVGHSVLCATFFCCAWRQCSAPSTSLGGVLPRNSALSGFTEPSQFPIYRVTARQTLYVEDGLRFFDF